MINTTINLNGIVTASLMLSAAAINCPVTITLSEAGFDYALDFPLS